MPGIGGPKFQPLPLDAVEVLLGGGGGGGGIPIVTLHSVCAVLSVEPSDANSTSEDSSQHCTRNQQVFGPFFLHRNAMKYVTYSQWIHAKCSHLIVCFHLQTPTFYCHLCID